MTHAPLRRIIGTPTALLIGMGVAVGSGIFRTPGVVAGELGTPWLILAAWVAGGLIVLAQGLVSAELATRYPKAGGEYVFLREAYGDFAAFFFGWGYTVFIVGGGAATISSAAGEFACELFDLPGEHSGALAAVVIVAVTAINAAGLRIGAGAQNALTIAKVVALLGVVAVGLIWGRAMATPAAAAAPSHSLTLSTLIAAVLSVFWAYDGTTDAIKMSEEMKDAQRAIPRAVIGATLSVIVLYVLVNWALMRLVPPAEMAGVKFVPGSAMDKVFGVAGRNAMLVVGIVACLGAVSSTVLATIRVTFALARDGLTFRFLGRMSKRQSPVAALLVVGVVAVVMVLNRNFMGVLRIYFFASAILFGLSYGSLIVFRLRDREFPAGAFRCPGGVVLAGLLILIQIGIAIGIAWDKPLDALYTAAILGILGVMYWFWRPARR